MISMNHADVTSAAGVFAGASARAFPAAAAQAAHPAFAAHAAAARKRRNATATDASVTRGST